MGSSGLLANLGAGDRKVDFRRKGSEQFNFRSHRPVITQRKRVRPSSDIAWRNLASIKRPVPATDGSNHLAHNLNAAR